MVRTLAAIPCLKFLAPALLEQLVEGAEVREMAGGTSLFAQGDVFLKKVLILEGSVKFYRQSEGGRPQAIKLIGSGECCCLAPFHDSASAPVYAECMTATRAVFIDAEKAGSRLSFDSSYSTEVIKCLVSRLSEVVQRMTSATESSIRSRLAGTLVECAEKCGHKDNEGFLLKHVTHKELSSWLGCSREVVSREISRLQKEGLVRSRRGKLLIRDLEGLRTLSLGK